MESSCSRYSRCSGEMHTCQDVCYLQKSGSGIKEEVGMENSSSPSEPV